MKRKLPVANLCLLYMFFHILYNAMLIRRYLISAPPPLLPAYNTYPCCWSSTNADLPGAFPTPSIVYFGVCGVSDPSIAEWGVPGGPSGCPYGLPRSVKFNVLTPSEATFQIKYLQLFFTIFLFYFCFKHNLISCWFYFIFFFLNFTMIYIFSKKNIPPETHWTNQSSDLFSSFIFQIFFFSTDLV